MIVEIIKILIATIMIITVIIIIVIYRKLWKWCKVGNRQMQYNICKKKKLKNLKPEKTKILKSQEYSNCHEPVPKNG